MSCGPGIREYTCCVYWNLFIDFFIDYWHKWEVHQFAVISVSETLKREWRQYLRILICIFYPWVKHMLVFENEKKFFIEIWGGTNYKIITEELCHCLLSISQGLILQVKKVNMTWIKVRPPNTLRKTITEVRNLLESVLNFLFAQTTHILCSDLQILFKYHYS